MQRMDISSIWRLEIGQEARVLSWYFADLEDFSYRESVLYRLYQKRFVEQCKWLRARYGKALYREIIVLAVCRAREIN